MEELPVRSLPGGGLSHVRKDLGADLIKTTARIIAKSGDPARVLEFYYWSRQPGLVELIRAFLALPERSRQALGTWLTKTPDGLIAVSTARNGRLTLSPPRARTGKKTKSYR
jgi:hypothetical protein